MFITVKVSFEVQPFQLPGNIEQHIGRQHLGKLRHNNTNIYHRYTRRFIIPMTRLYCSNIGIVRCNCVFMGFNVVYNNL